MQERLAILISGKRKSGKDYLAQRLLEHFGVRSPAKIIRISAPIKKEYARLHELSYGDLLTDGPYKEQHRKNMVNWSEDLRKADPSYFCNLAISENPCRGGTSRLHGAQVWIVSDIRRKSDVNFFQTLSQTTNVFLVRIFAEEFARKERGWTFVPGIDDEETECGLDAWNAWHFKFDNTEPSKFCLTFDKLLCELRPHLSQLSQVSSSKRSIMENGSSGSPPNKVTKSDYFSLGDFRLEEVLSESSDRKIAFLHAKNVAKGTGRTVDTGGASGESCGDAVVILEKRAFAEESLPRIFASEETKVCVDVQNDIYRNCSVVLPQEFNDVKGTIIYPASVKHIEKYRDQQIFMIQESPEDYENITLPHIKANAFSLEWVYNVLEHKKEADRIVFEDADPQLGFILAPDLKWDGVTKETLYLTAICLRRDIGCLRDLRAEHLPLLKNILAKSQETIASKYGVPANQLRCFVHYQPSYYHLHVHFTYLKYDAPGIYVGKAHLLEDIIAILESFPDFYQKAALCFALKANDGLCKKFLAGK